jgi:predicted ATPase
VFVGRQGELKQLHGYLRETVETRLPRLVFIEGDYGLGKTSLVTQFLSEVAASKDYPRINIGKGECMSGTQNSGLSPFVQLLRNAEKGASWELTEGELAGVLQEVAPAWFNILAMENATEATSTTGDTTGAERRAQTPYPPESIYYQFARAITELSKRSPMLFWIEDLHLVDEESLGLLDYLTNQLVDVPVLMIGTYRPVEMQTRPLAQLFGNIIDNLIGKGIAEEPISLKPDIKAAEYIGRRYPVNTFPPALVDLVEARGTGHPMYMSLLFSSWEQLGIITNEAPNAAGSEWTLTRSLDQIPMMPISVSRMLDSRIRLLSKELRAILERASVVGDEFTLQLIQMLLELDENSILEDMQALVNDYGLVRELDGPRDLILDRYQFAHSFYREHIYEKYLTNAKRRSFHGQVGEAMEQLYPDREPISGALANHFKVAGQPLKAARYALVAARLEQKRYSWGASENWCQFGLDQMRGVTTEEARVLQVDLLQQSGEGFYDRSDLERAVERFSAAAALAQSVGLDSDRVASLYTWIADAEDSQDEWDDAAEAVQSAKEILRTGKRRITDGLLRFLTVEGLVITRQGHNVEAACLLRQVIAEVERRPKTPWMTALASDANNNLGVALSYLGRYAESTAAFQKAADIAKLIGDPLRELPYKVNLVDDLIAVGRLDEAERIVRQVLELAREIPDRYSEAYALATQGSLLVRRGEYAAAIAMLHQSLAKWRECDEEGNRPYVEADLASAHLGLLELELAYEHGERGVQQAGTNQIALAYARDTLGQVQAARGDWELARATYEQGIATAEAAGVKHYAASARRHFADLVLQAGDRQRGLELLAQARETFLALDLVQEIASTGKVMAKWGITVVDLPAQPDLERSEIDKGSHRDGVLAPGDENKETAVAGILAWMGWEAEDAVAEGAAQYYSCFISYSSKDERFAEKLHADLAARGVECWFAPEDLRIGDRFRQRIDDEIRAHAKLLLVLSEASVASDWVASEVEAAFERERETKATLLFPIRLDEAVMATRSAWAAEIRRTRQIGDFRKWEDEAAYAKGLARVLRDLTR